MLYDMVREKIFEIVKNNPGSNINEIRTEAKMTYSTAEAYLEDLIKSRRLKRVDNQTEGKFCYYTPHEFKKVNKKNRNKDSGLDEIILV